MFAQYATEVLNDSLTPTSGQLNCAGGQLIEGAAPPLSDAYRACIHSLELHFVTNKAIIGTYAQCTDSFTVLRVELHSKWGKMPVWYLLVWLAIGGIAGYFAGQFMGANRPFGVLGDIGPGIVGSIIGGWILGLLGLGGSGILASLITAFIGAVALIWVVRLIKKA